MIVNFFLLLFSLLSGMGECSMLAVEVRVKAGEMAVLQFKKETSSGDATYVWTSSTLQGVTVISDLSLAEQQQMEALALGGSLVILRASANHQGNYSCSPGYDRNKTSQSWFQLTVYTNQSLETQNKQQKDCYTEESCQLSCPDESNPDSELINCSLKAIMWHKEGKLVNSYFNSVKKEDQGDYTCTRGCYYNGHLYNMSFMIELQVKPKVIKRAETITSPHDNEIFEVELGSAVVINCKALLNLHSEIFWLSNGSFVENNESFPVYYNCSKEESSELSMFTSLASLVIKNVSEEDLSKQYICKLDSTLQSSKMVNIRLKKLQKARPSYVSLVVIVVCIVLVTSVMVVVYVTFKIDVTLFVRDAAGCHGSPSGEKSYDAFLLCYKSETDAGLKVLDRKWLEGVLETSYGYSLCIWDRDIIPGGDEAEAMLECIERSKVVVLVPTSSDSDPESSLLSAIYAALVERQCKLVFVKTKTPKGATSVALPETLQHLSEVGDSVTWRGMSSKTSSSSFFKKLRYYLGAPQHPSNLSPETMEEVTVW